MEGFWVGVVLTACVAALIPHPSMQPSEWEWAVSVCATNGGIEAARPSGRFILPNKARCKNGAVFIRNASEPSP